MSKDSFLSRLEELSRQQKEAVGKLSSELGFDGTPIGSFDELARKDREGMKKKKSGRPKGRKNLTIRERLIRLYGS